MAHFCCGRPQQSVKILKGKKRPAWSRTINPKRVEALSAKFGNAIRADITTGIQGFKKRIPNPEVVYQAWLNGEYEGLDRVIPWNRLDDDLTPAKSRLADVMATFSDMGIEAIDHPDIAELRYDYKNPGITRIFNDRAGEWIQGITDSSRNSIRNVVKNQMNRGWSPRDVAEGIKGHIGLTPRLAIAADNYAEKVHGSGLVRPDKAAGMVYAYQNRLLDYRANSIARTETQFMLNRGQLDVWQEAQRQDLLKPTAKKVWITDGNPCEICEPMDGVAVGLNDSWVLSDGSTVDIPTESHPMCMCLMTISTEEE